ncbi:MAG: hypothetical protein R6X18_05855 [Chloroflexota bacterium]
MNTLIKLREIAVHTDLEPAEEVVRPTPLILARATPRPCLHTREDA